MKSLVRLLAVAVAAFLFAGCLESDQQTVLMPDGSGKIVWTFGVEMKEDNQEPLQKDKLEAMQKASEGIVAWSEPKVEKKDGWYRCTLTAYFEDISKVKLIDPQKPDEPALAFVLVKKGDGGTLTVKDQLTSDMTKKEAEQRKPETDEEKQQAEDMKAQMKKMMKGLKVGIGVKLPGKVTASEHFMKTDGRAASMTIDDKLMGDVMDEKEEAKKTMEGLQGERTATWEKNETTQEEIDAFKKELAAAKAEWEKKK